MSIALIVILIITVSLILGPVMMMRPNPAQKNKENMRSLARAKGVHYSLRNLPQQADEQDAPAAVPVYYFPPSKTQDSPNWMLVRTGYEHEIHLLGWWAWQGEPRASNAELEVLYKLLPGLPKSVRAISAGGRGVCVYWEEKGGDLALQQVLSLLEALKQSVANPG